MNSQSLIIGQMMLVTRMDYVNLVVGILLFVMGVIIVFVGNYFSKKIGILHVVIYFMATFVILTGILLIFLYDRPSILF